MRVGVIIGAILTASLAQAEATPELRIDSQRITLSGISAGGSMATQMHIAYADLFSGVGIIAGAPFACADGSLTTAMARCMGQSDDSLVVAQLAADIRAAAADGRVADVPALADDRVWLFHGTLDKVVAASVSDALAALYAEFVPPGQIRYVTDIAASHHFPTRGHGHACSASQPPFIGDCDYDAAGELLQHLYANLQTPATGSAGPLIETTLPDAAAAGLSDTAYLYVPPACGNGEQVCALHLVLHGCAQSAVQIGTDFIEQSGYLPWAEANNIVLAFPQVMTAAANPYACWDWWAYTGPDYRWRNGAQMSVLANWIRTLAAITPTAPAPAVSASELELPLALDYRILEQALEQQLFTGQGRTVEVYADRIRCNTMELSQPRVEGTDAGHVRILTTIKTHTGTPLGGRCLLAKSWLGVIETLHQASVDTQHSAVAFTIVDSNILQKDEHKPAVPRILQRWIKDYIHPRLDAVQIDLQPAVSGIQELVGNAFVATAADTLTMVSSLKLKSARPSPAALTIVLSLDVPAAPTDLQPAAQAALSAEELARWDAAWQAWDGFATWLIKTTAASAEPELADALAATLLDARYDLRDALALDDHQQDPVRALFVKTWDRLAPLLRESQPDLPGAQALPFATFIGATDALLALDRLAPYMGMRLDQQSLRSLARLLVPSVDEPDLAYDTAVDPALRQLLGLEPEFNEDDATTFLLDWLLRSAHAAALNPTLVKQLNGWVPKLQEVDEYLRIMAQLLDELSLAERDKGKVPTAFFKVYDTLLRATAWQESCWRQYIEKAGTVQAMLSSAGSVGLMQVNKHVWRGIYDIDTLTDNIGYNARAGNEILVHYLVDFAIRKREHEITGDANNLARATYAVYNGGPSHLKRYRNPASSKALKEIDRAFWDKYLAIQQEGAAAVKQCYAG